MGVKQAAHNGHQLLHCDLDRRGLARQQIIIVVEQVVRELT